MTSLHLLIDAVAAYRLTRLVVADSITEPLRDRVARFIRIHELVTCYWCSGMWVGAGVGMARWAVPTLWNPAAWALTVAAAAALLARLEPPE